MKQLFTAFILIFAFSACQVTSVHLVRHADRIVGQDQLSQAGLERAQELARVLADANIDVIYTTDTRRTRSTITPTSETANIPIEVYEVDDLASFARMIKKEHEGENVLIVGHSNTIPQTVNAFIPEAGLTDLPHTEYDKLYHVLVAGTKKKYMTYEYGDSTQ